MLAGDEYRGCSQRVALGSKVLAALPDQPTFQFLLEWYFNKTSECVFHKPSIMAWARSLWEDFPSVLSSPRDPDALDKLSDMICRNNSVAVSDDFDSYESWVAAFSGRNMRWETVGSVVAVLVSSLLGLSYRDCFFCCQGKTRKQFATEMKDCVQACVTLSNFMVSDVLP